MLYKVPFVNFAEQYSMYKPELDDAIKSVIQRGDLILREDVELFEKELAQYLGVQEVISVANGTDALMLSLYALGIGEGDEVITCSYTFRATIEAIHQVGATPVLVDIGEDWQQYITPKTKACIPAHLEGATLDWEPVEGIHMVEDACQAIGAKPLTGVTACYSFYPAKILGCLGDGGAIATNDKDLAEKLRRLRNHDKEIGELWAFNSRLDNLQAAVLRVRLQHLDEALTHRKFIAQKYDVGLWPKVQTPKHREVYQDYIIRVDDPVALKEKLEACGIQTMLNGYPFPPECPKKPKTVDYEAHTLRIPCNETLTLDQVEYVIKCIND